MAKKTGIIAGAIGSVAALGALLFSRGARADDLVSVTADDQPGLNGAELSPPVPEGSSPFGLRNNNPFNLKYFAIGWKGETGFVESPAGRFSVFDTAENGIRAGMINIHTKMTRDGANTVRKLLTLLSPAFENPLEAFITWTAQRIGVAPDQPLEFRQHILQLSKAIIRFENGEQPFTDAQLQAALLRTGRI